MNRIGLIFEMAMQNIGRTALFEEDDLLGLYDPSMMRIALQRQDWDSGINAVIAGMALRYNDLYQVYEVETVHARHGYGPIMYLAAMSKAGSSGLAPNRVGGHVTDDAKSIWQNFRSGVGQHWVETTPLDYDAHLHHEEDFLNMRYVLKQPLDLSTARRRNQSVLSRDQHEEKRGLLAELIDAFIRYEMRRIYDR